MYLVPTGQTVNKEYYVEVLRESRKRFRWKRPALFKSGQWHFHQDIAPVHNSILVTDYLTKMGIKAVPHPPYRPDLAPCDFRLFPKLKEKLRGCRHETIEEMKEALTKVIETLTQKELPWGFPEIVGTVQQVHCNRRRLLRRGLEFHMCTINKSANTKKVWKLIKGTSYVEKIIFFRIRIQSCWFTNLYIYILYIYIYICIFAYINYYIFTDYFAIYKQWWLSIFFTLSHSGILGRSWIIQNVNENWHMVKWFSFLYRLSITKFMILF